MSSGWGNSGLGGGGGAFTDRSLTSETITLNSTDITNKYVILNEAPSPGQLPQVILRISGGTTPVYGTAFQVTTDNGGKRLSWDGLTLDGKLVAGDIIIVSYPLVVIE